MWLSVLNAVHARLQVQADVDSERQLAASTAMRRSEATRRQDDAEEAPAPASGKRKRASAAKGKAAAPKAREGKAAAAEAPPCTEAAVLGATMRNRLKALGVDTEVEDI